jgi:hypothetical protein
MAEPITSATGVPGLGKAAKLKPRKEKRPKDGPRGLDQLRAGLAAAAEGDTPVLVGPFTGEVGFELLYWRPLIRWAVREYPRLADRLVIVSRGGSWHWWQSMLECSYVDILTLYEPGDYVARKGADKQRHEKDYDFEILERVKRKLGIEQARVLHPSLLFEFYYQARKGSRFAFAEAVTQTDEAVEGLSAIYEPIPPPELLPELATVLPERYVAMRFYFRDSFPDTDENRRFAARTIENVASRVPVVLLNNGIELDEHRDLELTGGGENVVSVHHLMRPENNLHIQTVVLSRAQGYIGTYGGLSYLAPFLGHPSIGFRSLLAENHGWHTTLAERVFETAGWASLLTLDSADTKLLDLLGAGA